MCSDCVVYAGKALELAGDSVKAHYLLANAHLNLEHLDEAEASFQVARVMLHLCVCVNVYAYAHTYMYL